MKSNLKDITLGEGVTTISLDDEKIGYGGDMQSFTIIKKARNADNYIDSEAQLLTVPARSIMSDDIKSITQRKRLQFQPVINMVQQVQIIQTVVPDKKRNSNSSTIRKDLSI